jgi:two-component system sensor histidine kinase/response regulator
MDKKNTSRQVVVQYIAAVGVSALVVCAFAFIQYSLIQKHNFILADYFIPIIVGSIFGVLIARIRILLKNLSIEREIVIEKNKKIHSYIGTIVHDLKSPLSAVHSLMDLFGEESDRLSDDQKTYLTFMKQSSTSMLENISLILDNTRLEAGVKPDHLEVGNPYFTIQSTIDKYLIEALNKSISIQRLIDKNLPLVEYDKNLLDRILSNLISNAIKYSPANTQVKIYSEVFAHRLNIVVKDQGLGMSEEDLKNVFQEFKKLSARPTGAESSTGLGLSIAKKLVDQLGGEIVARSDGKDKGSEFEIKLNIKSLGT